MRPQIKVTENITLVSIQNISADMTFIAQMFKSIADKGIDVDMISLSPVQSAFTSVSFSVQDSDLIKILEYTASLKDKGIKPIVSSNNSIISIVDNEMEETPGVAAKVFAAIADVQTDIRIITTSEVQISLLVTSADFDKAYSAIKNCIKEL